MALLLKLPEMFYVQVCPGTVQFWLLVFDFTRFINFAWTHHWRNYWIYSGSMYRLHTLPPLMWFSVLPSNRIASALAFCTFHPMILSFMLLCWHYPWVQKASVYMAISGKLAKLSRASMLNSHFLSKCSACSVVMPKHQWFSPQQKTLI